MIAAKRVSEHPVGGTGLRMYGTGCSDEHLKQCGFVPTRNFHDGDFPTADNLAARPDGEDSDSSAGLFLMHYLLRSCHPSNQSEIRWRGEGPELKRLGFGSDCGVDDMDAITKANYLCNELGLDTITCAATIACAMACMKAAYITTKDTGGWQFRWQLTENMVKLVEMYRQS